jgi:hypothetical protein
MQLVGGIGEGIGAAGAMTSPSGVSQIGGVVLGYKAVDDIAAGIRGLQTGEYQRTVVSAAGERVALDLGATPEQAAMAGAVTDAAVSMGASVAAGAVPRALAKGSATSSPETAGRLSPVGGGELSPPPPTGQLSIPKTPPTPKDLALELKAAAPPNLPQTINVINTEGGPTIVTTGGVPLTKEQLAIADFRELVIGDFAKGFDAEPMGLYTAGRLGVVPTKGYSTNIMCSHCQWQVPDLANQGGYNFILSQDERSYCFVKR